MWWDGEIRVHAVSHCLNLEPNIFFSINSRWILSGTSNKESAYWYRRHKRCRFNPWSGRSPRGGNGTLLLWSPGGGNGTLQVSCLENPIDRRAGGLQSTGLKRVRHDWTSVHSTTAPTGFLSFKVQNHCNQYSLLVFRWRWFLRWKFPFWWGNSLSWVFPMYCCCCCPVTK